MSNTSIFHHGGKQLHLLGNCCPEPDCNECGQDEIDIFSDDSEFGFGEPVSVDGCPHQGRRHLCSESSCWDIFGHCCHTGEWGGVQHKWDISSVLYGEGGGQPGIHGWNAVTINEQIPSGTDIGHNHLVQGTCGIQCVDYRKWYALQFVDDNFDEGGWDHSIATNEFNNSECGFLGCGWNSVFEPDRRRRCVVLGFVWKHDILQWRNATQRNFLSS